MKKAEKREWAKLLFIHQSLTQQEIADKVGVSKVTINAWAKKDKWDELKASLTITREEELKRLYTQIAEINKVIAERERKYPSTQEADIISKIAVAIDKLEREVGLSDIISVSMKILNFVRTYDLDKAKELSDIFDAYIRDSQK